MPAPWRTRDLADVEAAIVAVRDAVARMPVRHPSYPGFTLMLGRLLDRRAGDSSTVDETGGRLPCRAVAGVGGRAKRTKPDSPGRRPVALAAALMARIDLPMS